MRFQAEGVFSAPAQESNEAVGERYSSPLERTAQATRASLLAAATISTFTWCSPLKRIEAMDRTAIRSRFDAEYSGSGPVHRSFRR